MSDPLVLRAYLAAGHLLRPLVDRHLKRRVQRGKEDPARIQEKQGIAGKARPNGLLIWCHAVGVGEALALTGFASAITKLMPATHLLITTSSRNAAGVLGRNIPANAIHQYLPVDVPPYVSRFLDHWQPDLTVWAERDIWPRAMVEVARRNTPQVIVNGRMTAKSFEQKARLRRLFQACYGRCTFIDVQDEISEKHFSSLAPNVQVSVSGSLKAYGTPLADTPKERRTWAELLPTKLWVAASIHPEEFEKVLTADTLLAANGWTSILAPRNPSDASALATQVQNAGKSVALASNGPHKADVIIEDRLGYLGLWFRQARFAFVGGSWDKTGGHNPYEPARLGCAFFHGPNISNFEPDYAHFKIAGLRTKVTTPEALSATVLQTDLAVLGQRAFEISNQGEKAVTELAARCLALIHHAE